MKILILFMTLFCLEQTFASDLYMRSFGKPSDPALIFVHGGPGHNSQDFEWTTASKLASLGFFVVVYDQRGQGRSDVTQNPQDYSYQKYAEDLRAIIQEYQLVRPVLLGHSHGGAIALKFDQIYPGVVGKIILVSAPVNFWKSIESIQINCTSRYLKSGNTTDLAILNANFELFQKKDLSLDKEIGAVATVFGLGADPKCGLYRTAFPNSKSLELKQILSQNSVKIPEENLSYPMPNFLINEHYIYMDHSGWVQQHADYIFGIYGDEDGLFTPEVLQEIQSNLKGNPSPYRFQVLKGASHRLYTDQQDLFFSALMSIL